MNQARGKTSVVWIAATSSVASCLLTFLLGAVWAYQMVDFSFFPNEACVRNGSEHVNLCFFSDNFNSEAYLSVISDFYGTIISILMGLLAAVAGLAFFTVRAQALNQSDEVFEREVSRFFETDSGKQVAARVLDGIFDQRSTDILNRLTQIESALDDAGIATFEGRLNVDEPQET